MAIPRKQKGCEGQKRFTPFLFFTLVHGGTSSLLSYDGYKEGSGFISPYPHFFLNSVNNLFFSLKMAVAEISFAIKLSQSFVSIIIGTPKLKSIKQSNGIAKC
jgi:hypothetical protein